MNCWLFEAMFRGGHVHVRVRCGEQHHSRPLLGLLTMTPGQWAELHEVLADRADVEVMDVEFMEEEAG